MFEPVREILAHRLPAGGNGQALPLIRERLDKLAVHIIPALAVEVFALTIFQRQPSHPAAVRALRDATGAVGLLLVVPLPANHRFSYLARGYERAGPVE